MRFRRRRFRAGRRGYAPRRAGGRRRMGRRSRRVMVIGQRF